MYKVNCISYEFLFIYLFLQTISNILNYIFYQTQFDSNEALLAAKKNKKKNLSYIAGYIWWSYTLRSVKSYYYLFFIMISKTFEILLGSNLLIAHYPLLSSDCLCILFPPPFGCLQALHWRGLPFPCLEYSGS